MRVELIRCEICKKDHDAWQVLSPEWFTIRQAGQWIQGTTEHQVEERHYCSQACLVKSLGAQQSQKPIKAPASKMRRFLLVDGETADEAEGVKWSDGSVTLKPSLPEYESWDAFKACFDGCGITWIDQEKVSDE